MTREITFKSIEIQNFKGIKHKVINFEHDTKIMGKNGSGKTSVADAIMFCLFNKSVVGDSPLKAGFKTVDENGEDVRDLTMSVELKILVDGIEKIFKREQSEIWRVVKGLNTKVFGGNVQSLFFNESKEDTKGYEQKVNEVTDEETFKLLTNPHHFLNVVDAKKRREILMELVNERNEEIENQLKQSPQFESLMVEWNSDLNKDKSFESFKEWISSKSKVDNAELKSIPGKIQELERTIGDVVDVNSINVLILNYQKEIEKIDEQLNTKVSIPEWVFEYENNSNELLQQASKIENEEYSKANELYSSISMSNNLKSNALQNLKNKEIGLVNEIQILEERIQTDVDTREDLYKDYDALGLESFETSKYYLSEHDKVCKACNRDLETETVETLLETKQNEYKEDFDYRKNQILVNGEALSSRIKTNEEYLKEHKDLLEKLKNDIQVSTLEVSNLVTPKIPQIEQTEESIKLRNKSKELLEKVNDFRTKDVKEVDNTELLNQKQGYNLMISDANRKLGAVEQQEVTRRSIKELELKEQVLSENKIKFELLLNLIEEFVKEKNIAFETELSNHFNHVKWQLFEVQGNGGFKQVCEPLLDGKNLSQQSLGEQIFVGIDIIKTFSDIKDIKVPVIIDNRESLTIPLDLKQQSISMYVNENYNEMEIM